MISIPTRTPSPGCDDAPCALFDRLLAAVDKTLESLVDIAGARRLCSSTGQLELIAFVERPYAVRVGPPSRSRSWRARMRRWSARELTELDSVRGVVGRRGLHGPRALGSLSELAAFICALLGMAVTRLLAILDGRKRDGTASRRA